MAEPSEGKVDVSMEEEYDCLSDEYVEITEAESKDEDDTTMPQDSQPEPPVEVEEPKKKRKYNKTPIKDSLSGSYWKTPNVEVNTRPRRSNAGSLMKSALQEIDSSKKRRSSPAKAQASPAAQRQSSRAEKSVEPTPSTSTNSRKPKSETPSRVQPYEKPVTRGRGRPRKSSTVKVESEDDDEDEPMDKNKKVTGKEVSRPLRTYSRRSRTAMEEKPTPPKPEVRTYSRRRQAKTEQREEQETNENRSTSPARVTPSMALIATLSIPEELLPTSHEKFLDKFRETQEKSPTPPDLRVPNLDEVVANYKSSHPKNGDNSSYNSDSEKSETESNSESTTSHSDEKENAADVLQAAGSIARIPKDPKGWVEDQPIAVVKLGNNQLLINNNIVDIDYENYVKEADVEIPYDYDVIFEPEPKLETPILDDFSCPGSPTTKVEVDDVVEQECKLEACKNGCVCKSLRMGTPLREHCGRPKCFLECSCLFKDQLLITGDERNIRSRLRPRVTLLNWKHITKGGHDRRESGEHRKHKLHKTRIGKKKRLDKTEEPSRKRSRKTKELEVPVRSPLKSPRSQAVPYSRPGPKSSKLKFQSSSSPARTSPQKSSGRATGRVIRKPTLISTRFASNLPILRRIYSCQPCNVRITKMPTKWSDWRAVESHCSSDVQRKTPSGESNVPSFQTASSSFRVTAQGDLSYTIVRPDGSILALLYWQSHTKQAPRSMHLKPKNSNDLSFPWLYLPLPSSGKVWLFYEIPKYAKDTTSVWLPEIGVFLPTDTLMLKMKETSQTEKTSKLYFENGDGSKLIGEGLLSFAYLVPNLPSLIVYGPVPKNCLKVPTSRSTDATLRTFEESENSKHMTQKLDAAGTDVIEVKPAVIVETFEPEFEDDIDRGADLIEDEVWENVYADYMIAADGDSEDEESDTDMIYDFEADSLEEFFGINNNEQTGVKINNNRMYLNVC